MDHEKYKALLCAIDMKSLSAAADRLGYTPSGMSRRLDAMEKELGFPLLIRRHAGVFPTPECSALLPVIRELVHHGDHLKRSAAALRDIETGTVTVATTIPATYPWLGEIMEAFKKEHPGIDLQMILSGGYSSKLCQMVENRLLDFCIVSRRRGGFAWHPLFIDPMVGWVSANSEYARRSWISPQELAAGRYIALSPDAETDTSLFFADLGITPNICYRANDSYAVYCMVEAGLGVSMNNGFTAMKWTGTVVSVPLKPARNIEIGIASPIKSEISPAANCFLKFALEHISLNGVDPSRNLLGAKKRPATPSRRA